MLINGDHYTGKTKMQSCKGYVEALEEERRKICVFRRELPLCVELVTQVIEVCKQQLPGTTTECFHGQLECSEQKSSKGPLLDQIIPVKRISSISDDDEQQSQEIKYNNIIDNKDSTNNVRFPNNKSDMLRFVLLWKQEPDPTIKEDYPRRVSVREVNRDCRGGAFHLFNREKVGEMEGARESLQRSSSSSAVPATAGSSTTGTGGSSRGSYGCGSKKEEKGEASQTKERRCWSPELHRQFLYALQQLGGSHVATPKQIKEIMIFDGMTNDEVKSHLQKYRLHERRQNPSIHENHHPKAVLPQSIVVGGIWMPRPEYAAMATTAESGEVVSGIALSNGVYYAPIATMPAPLPEPESEPSPVSLNKSQQHRRLNSDDTDGHIEGGFRSDSPAASYSTHSTTASPAF